MESRFISRSIAVRETPKELWNGLGGGCTHVDGDISSRSARVDSSLVLRST
jgi:hypothetical protein